MLRWLFRLRTPKAPIFDPQASQMVLQHELRATMQEAVLLAEREVASRTPVGATGILRGSIASEIRGTPANLRGIVATPQPYAAAVEHGSRPHWAPIGPLLLWARRKLGDERAAYRVQWAISRRGTRGVHMFRDAERAIRQPVTRLFQEAMARIRRRLGG
jgi:hypothetical protein